MNTFNDIVFKQRPFGGIMGTLNLNEFKLSVVAGKGMYSLPREDFDDESLFSKFEVAILKNDDFVTKEFFPDNPDDVIGWQTRTDIDELIKKMI